MPANNYDRVLPKFNIRQHWPLVGLMIMVLTVSMLAFQSPIAQDRVEITSQIDNAPSNAIILDDAAYPVETSGADEQMLAPEEIGYTDWIIFWSTVLVLILLVATIREMIHRKGI